MEYFDVQLRQQLRVGIPARQIVEVLSFKSHEICPVTGVHSLLLGVINWRGKILWSLDLSDFLQLKAERLAPASSLSSATRNELAAVVISGASEETGAERSLVCVVSALKGIIQVPKTQINPVTSPPFPASLCQVFRGIARREAPLLLLDTERLLDVSSWQVPAHG